MAKMWVCGIECGREGLPVGCQGWGGINAYIQKWKENEIKVTEASE